MKSKSIIAMVTATLFTMNASAAAMWEFGTQNGDFAMLKENANSFLWATFKRGMTAEELMKNLSYTYTKASDRAYLKKMLATHGKKYSISESQHTETTFSFKMASGQSIRIELVDAKNGQVKINGSTVRMDPKQPVSQHFAAIQKAMQGSVAGTSWINLILPRLAHAEGDESGLLMIIALGVWWLLQNQSAHASPVNSLATLQLVGDSCQFGLLDDDQKHILAGLGSSQVVAEAGSPNFEQNCSDYLAKNKTVFKSSEGKSVCDAVKKISQNCKEQLKSLPGAQDNVPQDDIQR